MLLYNIDSSYYGLFHNCVFSYMLFSFFNWYAINQLYTFDTGILSLQNKQVTVFTSTEKYALSFILQ